MKYRYSHTDEQNLKWFETDMTRATLVAVRLQTGELRGLSNFSIEFKYPISVIAGPNCSGKSTILALVACAYHNAKTGFRPIGRKTPYYTMSDFFVQSAEEIPPEGITISYEFLHDRWRKSPRLPEGIGRGKQVRSKRKGGKWTKYAGRVKRNVVFFGIERVVPHSERSVSKSYRHYFRKAQEEGYEPKVREIVGRILGRQYDDFWFAAHSKYRLPHVKSKNTIYSGFNMGAGENALLEIFSTIFAAPEGLLLVIDEIELGLHESAQKRLIEELKKLCNERHIQVICTTHSSTILEAVPPEGRFFIERYDSETRVTTGISPSYAAGRLAEINSQELNIYVEDGIAQYIVQSILSTEIRRRVNILPIGSVNAVLRQLAAHYKDHHRGECMAILDGDQKSHKQQQKYFANCLEVSDVSDEYVTWFSKRVVCLPGDTWPEKWIFTQLIELDLKPLSESFQIGVNELRNLCEQAIMAGKHREFYTLSQHLSLPFKKVCFTICEWLAKIKKDEFENLRHAIALLLN